MPKLSVPIIALFLLTLTGFQAHAQVPREAADGLPPDTARAYPATWQGYLVDLPAPPPTVLLEEVRALRAEMIERRDVLDNRVGASKLTVPEVLIAIAVPGGLAYLIGKTTWRLRAQKALETASTDLEYLDEDLLAFQGMSSVYVIALAQGEQPGSPPAGRIKNGDRLEWH